MGGKRRADPEGKAAVGRMEDRCERHNFEQRGKMEADAVCRGGTSHLFPSLLGSVLPLPRCSKGVLGVCAHPATAPCPVA